MLFELVAREVPNEFPDNYLPLALMGKLPPGTFLSLIKILGDFHIPALFLISAAEIPRAALLVFIFELGNPKLNALFSHAPIGWERDSKGPL